MLISRKRREFTEQLRCVRSDAGINQAVRSQ